MILSKYVKIKPSSVTIKHYLEKNYDAKTRVEIEVRVEDLTRGSKVKIEVLCDMCEKRNEIVYGDYFKQTNNLSEKYFCKKCSWEKIKNTNLEKYGSEYYLTSDVGKEVIKNIMIDRYGVENAYQMDINIEKRKKTNLEKYGSEYPLQSNIVKEKISSIKNEIYNKRCSAFLKKYKSLSPFGDVEVREKSKKTNLEKYGSEYYLSSSVGKNNIKNINMEKYACENVFQSDIIKEKIKKTNLEKYGSEYPIQCDDIKVKSKKTYNKKTLKKYLEKMDINEYSIEDYDNNFFEIYHIKCGEIFKIKISNVIDRYNDNLCLCTKCYPISDQKSIKEKDILNFLKSLNISIVENDRKILNGKELDIYIPEYNLAIEFNGLYWHSEKYKDKNYHLDKSLKCLEKGIDLIHIWEDEWIFKQDIVKSIISNRLNKNNKIYARKCVVKSVDKLDIKNFLETNHIDGYVKSDVNIGLYYNNELVCLMCLKKKKNDFEIVRTCTKLNYTVIGGVSKLLNHLKKNYKFDNITTSTDFRLFNGKVYENLGFEKHKLSKPNYFWCNKLDRLKSKKDNCFKLYDSGICKWLYTKHIIH